MIQVSHKPGEVTVVATAPMGFVVRTDMTIQEARDLAFTLWDAVREAEQAQANHRKSVSRKRVKDAHATNNRGGKP